MAAHMADNLETVLTTAHTCINADAFQVIGCTTESTDSRGTTYLLKNEKKAPKVTVGSNGRFVRFNIKVIIAACGNTGPSMISFKVHKDQLPSDKDVVFVQMPKEWNASKNPVWVAMYHKKDMVQKS